MAKKNLQATDFDTFDDGLDDFNFDDFNFGSPQQTDDRHPVIKSISPVGKAAKSYVTDRGNVERFVKAALPRGYGQVMDLGNESASELKALYNSARDELAPVNNLAKSVIGKALPKVGDKLPKSLRDKLEAYSKPEEQWQSSRKDNQEERLAGLLGEVFGQQVEQRKQDQETFVKKEQLRQGFEQVRHNDSMGQLGAMRMALESQVQFQNKVTFNYNKKSLELKYRTFWAIAELVKEQKTSNAQINQALQDTVKNTGLPDFVKMRKSESFREMMRNKFLDTAREGMFGGGQAYLRKFSRNLRDQAVRGMAGLGQMAGAMQSAGETMDGIQLSPEQEREMMVAGLLQLPMDWLSEKGAKFVKTRFTNRNSKTRRFGHRLSNFHDSIGDRIHESLSDPNKDWGGFEAVREFLRNAAPNAASDTRMETDALGRANEPIPFSRSNSKALNEIIPGLLSRIHQEIKSLRTGEEVTDLLTYDYGRNRFTTEKALGSRLRETMIGRHGERARKQVSEMLDSVDLGKKLTPEQREIASREILRKSMTGKSMDISNIYSGHHWGGGKDGEAIAGVFNRYLRASDGKLSNNGKSNERQMRLSRDFRGLTTGMGDPRAEAQMLVNVGQMEMLQRAGLIDESNSLSREAFARILAGDQIGEQYEAGPGPRGVTAPRKVRRPGEKESIAAAAAPMRDASMSSGLLTSYSSQSLDELKAIREALIDKARPSTTGIDDSQLAKDVKSIEEAILRIEEASGQMASAQVNIVGSIAEKMGAEVKDNRFSNLWEYARDRGGKAARRFKTMSKRFYRTTGKPAARAAIRGMDALVDWSETKVGELSNRLSGFYGDVFITGERYPRLRASVMKAGGYFDANTKRVINSLEEITGDVVDASGNVVVTFEELSKGYVGGDIRKNVSEIIKNVSGKLTALKAKLTEIIPDGVIRAKNLAMGAANFIKEKLPPYDVYVVGQMDKPILYANLMRYQQYFSQNTSKPITHPRQIDGPVVDKDGNVILSLEHLQKGIVDKDGVPAGNRGLARLALKGLNWAKKAFGRLREGASTALGILGQYMGQFGDFFKNMFMPFTDVITNSRKTVEWLEKIHNILDTRMAGGKVAGDADGDGIRDGSLADIRNKKGEEKDKKGKDGENNADGTKKPGFLASFMSGLASMFGKKKKDDEKEDDDEDSLLDKAKDALDVASDADDLLDRRNRGERGRKDRTKAAKKRLKRMKARGKPGLMSRGAKAVGRGLSRPLGFIGRTFFTTALARGAMTAGSAALGAGGAALGGLATAGGAVLPYAAQALGLLASWPATLLIGGGYLGYKAYQYNKKTKASPLSNLRALQYGVKLEEEKNLARVWELEQLLEEHVVVDGERIGIDMKKLDKEKIIELMELGKGDSGTFNSYLKTRFLPVFSFWVRQARKYDKDGKLAKLESLIPAKDKWTVAKASVNELGDATAYTYGWNSTTAKLAIGSQQVSEYLERISLELQREGEKAGGEKAVAEVKTETEMKNRSADEMAALALKNQDMYKVKDKKGGEINPNSLTATELAEKIRSGEASVSVALNVPKTLQHSASMNQLDALTTIRMKAYGLKEMALTRVQQLGALERYMADHLEGSIESPVASVKTDKILSDCAEIFGVPGLTGQHAERWRNWFNGRFLPVFLLYAGTVRRKTKKKELDIGVKEFPIADQLALARAIVAVEGPIPGGGRGPVWRIPSNPWNDSTEMNDNPDTTAGNVEAIRQLADKVTLGQVSARVASNREMDENKAAFGWYNTGRRSVSRGTNNDKGKGIQASGDALKGPAYGAGPAAVADAKAIAASGASLSFGSVTNGAYNQMPEMRGTGWSAAKDLINAAAKATGVDARALAGMIAQESSFDPNAMPRGYAMGSTAKGLGQHLDGSWAEDMKFHARELGIPAGTSQFDPKASALLTAMRMRRNGMGLEKLLGRKPTMAEVYMSHFMGAEGAASVLKQPSNALSINSEKGSNAKTQHPEYFYDKNKRPFTVKETVDFITERLTNKMSKAGVKETDFNGSRMTATDNPAAASATAPPSPEKQAVARADMGVSPVPPGAASAGGAAAAAAAPMGSAVEPLKKPVVHDTSISANTQATGTMPTGKDGITLYLQREESQDDGTYGVLRLPDGTTFMTLELAWRDNKNSVSCIPPGSYKCERRPTSRHGNAYEVKAVPGRSGILIHKGNVAGNAEKGQKAHSSGCILLGMGRARQGDQKTITSSGAAMDLFYQKLGGAPFTLVVQPSKNAAANMGSTDSAGSVSFSSMRENTSPATTPVVQQTSAYARSAAASPSPSPAAASSAPSEEPALPRLSKPKTDLPMRTQPTANEMAARDDALAKVMVPKFDTIQGTLSDSLTELRKIVRIMEAQQGEQKKAAEKPEAAATVNPPTSSTATVQRRRSM